MSADPPHGPEPPADGSSGRGVPDPHAEELAWQAIIENYGERPALDEPADEPAAAPAPPPRVEPVVDDEHFVPPLPPPLPKPPPVRLLAWIGLFGVPTVVLVAVVFGFAFPQWLSLLLLLWFVGGFGYLVATMRSREDDDPGNGAVV